METIVIQKQKHNFEVRARRLTRYFLSTGFLYLKIELEANVEPDDYGRESTCDKCSGTGRRSCEQCSGTRHLEIRCSRCDGEGVLINTENAHSHPCPDCEDGQRETECDDCSDGEVDCSDCSGSGTLENENWHDDYHDAFLEAFEKKLGNTRDDLKYLRIYYDGSVDTEATLTLRVDYIKELPDIVRAFAQTCQAFGSCHTGNAGLHITFRKVFLSLGFGRESDLLSIWSDFRFDFFEVLL